MDIVDRIFELVDAQYKEQRDFAVAINVDPSHISRWRNRKTSSYQRRLPQIAAALNTTTEYLLTGNGPKVKTPVAVSEMDTITPEEQRLLMAYRIADARAKEMVRLALEPFGLSESSDAAM